MNAQEAAGATEEIIRNFSIEAQQEAMIRERTRCMGIVLQGGSTQEMCNKITGKDVVIFTTNNLETLSIPSGRSKSVGSEGTTHFFEDYANRESARIFPDGTYKMADDMTPNEALKIMSMVLETAAGFLKERNELLSSVTDDEVILKIRCDELRGELDKTKHLLSIEKTAHEHWRGIYDGDTLQMKEEIDRLSIALSTMCKAADSVRNVHPISNT